VGLVWGGLVVAVVSRLPFVSHGNDHDDTAHPGVENGTDHNTEHSADSDTH
jgi:hypothetical protein